MCISKFRETRKWLVVLSCVVASVPGIAHAQTCYAPPTPRTLTADESKAVVITFKDHPSSSNFDFSLGRTLGSIISTSSQKVADSPAERIALLAGKIRSFRFTERLNLDSNLTLRFEPRLGEKGEASLDPIKLLSNGPGSMRPLALFNRWDLVPKDGEAHHCGEHRIVYGRDADPVTDPPGNPPVRFFLIFEAAIDNPDNGKRLTGCRPVVEFWKNLQNKSGDELMQALETFYFKGLDTDGDGKPDFQPVVHAQHYGAPYGQVRGNVFMHQGSPQKNRWLLREWRVSITSDGAPVFTVDTVKKNPHPALYKPTSELEIEGGFDALRRDFADEFIRVSEGELTEHDPRSAAGNLSGNILIEQLAANFAPRFDSFQSISQTDADNPAIGVDGTLNTRIGDRLGTLGIPTACGLLAEHILNRAGTVSCGGCHQFSSNKTIAPGVAWPTQEVPFVHVNQDGTLSKALRDHFLPARYAKLIGQFPAATASGQPTPLEPAVTVGTARTARDRVKSAESRQPALQALQIFESQVEELRAQERVREGAFYRIRRVH